MKSQSTKPWRVLVACSLAPFFPPKRQREKKAIPAPTSWPMPAPHPNSQLMGGPVNDMTHTISDPDPDPGPGRGPATTTLPPPSFGEGAQHGEVGATFIGRRAAAQRVAWGSMASVHDGSMLWTVKCRRSDTVAALGGRSRESRSAMTVSIRDCGIGGAIAVKASHHQALRPQTPTMLRCRSMEICRAGGCAR